MEAGNQSEDALSPEFEELKGLVRGIKPGEVIIIGSGAGLGISSLRGSGKYQMTKMMIEQAIKEHPGSPCCEVAGHEVPLLVIDDCDNSPEAIESRRASFEKFMATERVSEAVKVTGWDEPGGKRKAQWKRETGFGSGRFYQRQVRKR